MGLLDADGAAAEGLAAALAAVRDREPLADLAERVAGLAAELADVVAEARDRVDTIDDDPEQLAALRERRALLRELRRKYGDTLGEVLTFRTEIAERLAELESHDERAAELDAERIRLSGELDAERSRVRAEREASAPLLGAAVEGHLHGLAMQGARLAVTVDGPAGDEVVIELAANAGHDPMPLSKVASGGELARTMLALRLVVTAGPPTLVFDEVDAGIGGEAAHAVGRSLAALADRHQVLVVTHLAQVAAAADHHVAVTKRDVGGTTLSAAHLLDDEARIVELSRLLSGSPDSEAARVHAVELREAALAGRARS